MALVRTQRSALQSASIPAPVGGINTVSPGLNLPPSDSIMSYNMIGGQYGLRSRLGWSEWCTGLAGEQVRSIHPFTGSVKSGANNRLFAMTESGIWDVSSSGAAAYGIPVSVVAGAGGSGTMPANTYYFVMTVIPSGASESGPSEELTAVVPANGSVTVTFNLPYATGSDLYRLYIGTVSGTYTGYVAWAASGAPPQVEVVTTTGVATAGPPSGPTRVLDFASATTDSGWGVSTVFVNSGGDHFLCYCDEENGYHVYSETGAAWTVGGLTANPVTGVTPANLAFVMEWKNRLWFIEKDTAFGWYLDLGAVTGAATAFNFGSQFRAGGDLRCLANWTGDAGAGIDDALVGVSGGGDVLVYQGTDPNIAGAFSLRGVWSVGAVPLGRTLTTTSGGDLLVMGSTGIQSMSVLVRSGADVPTQYATAKIANLWAQVQSSTRTSRGWSMVIHPEEAALMVLIPDAAVGQSQQLVMSLITKGWHQYRSTPMGVCAAPLDGKLYFGTDDGRICRMDGEVDGVTLNDPSSYMEIEWSVLTGFSNLGRPTQKRVHFLRPTLLSQGGSVPYDVVARFRWDLREINSVLGAANAGSSAWDAGLWDQAIWGGGTVSQQGTFGAAGMGPEVAIAIRGKSVARTTLVGIDVGYSEGGFL